MNVSTRLPAGGIGSQGLGVVVLVAIGAVAISSLALPSVRGYGTIWFQIVTLYGWHFAQAVTSVGFVQRHREWGWAVAGLLNTIMFAIPTLVVWWVCRTRWSNVGRLLVAVWCVFYLASLFFLFRATDGP